MFLTYFCTEQQENLWGIPEDYSPFSNTFLKPNLPKPLNSFWMSITYQDWLCQRLQSYSSSPRLGRLAPCASVYFKIILFISSVSSFKTPVLVN